MIRVGNQKPELFFVPASNDMSHFTPSHYATNDFYYLSLDQYMEKLEFDTFDVKSVGTIDEAMKTGDLSKIVESVMATLPGQQMQRLIWKANGQLWQFNAVSSDLKGYVRQVVVLGGNGMKRWTWFDAHVKLPVFRFTANLLNRLRKRKTDREWADWQAFLDKSRNKNVV